MNARAAEFISSRAFDKLMQAIKEVGFPIVVTMILLGGGYILGDRIITSQGKFGDSMLTTQKTQESILVEVLANQKICLENQKRTLDILERMENKTGNLP